LSRLPPSVKRFRSGWSKRTPVSSTATTMLRELPLTAAQAASTLIDASTSPCGARKYHCPTAGPALVCPSA
jgi:hypothetical protein